MERAVSNKHRQFISEYLIDLNPTQAAIRAGYTSRSARTQAYRMMTNDNIQKEIQTQLAIRANKIKISQEQVVRELATIAFSSIGHVMDWNGKDVKILPRSQIGPDKLAAIKHFSFKKNKHGESIDIRFGDKVKALHLLGLHLGMFNGKPEKDKEEERKQDRQVILARLKETFQKLKLQSVP